MDRESKIMVVGMVIFVMIMVSVAIYGFIYSFEQHNEQDNNLIGEGIVTNKDVERVEDFPGTSTFYLITLDHHTEYEINEDTYYMVKVGNSVKVYESGRVEII